MFLTAMAGNLLAQNLAEKTAHVHVTWMNWFLAAIVPGIVSLIVIPFIIYKMYPPTVKETPDAKDWAENELADMGSIAKAEKFMIGVFIIALLLWVVGSFIGVDATLTAFIALSLLLITGVLDWKDILNETGAWNTLFVLSASYDGRSTESIRLYSMVKPYYRKQFRRSKLASRPCDTNNLLFLFTLFIC